MVQSECYNSSKSFLRAKIKSKSNFINNAFKAAF